LLEFEPFAVQGNLQGDLPEPVRSVPRRNAASQGKLLT
jgi:hypothetical protein